MRGISNLLRGRAQSRISNFKKSNALALSAGLMSLLMGSSAAADASNFLWSLEREFFFQAPRLQSVAMQVRIAQPSTIQRWGIVGEDAAAHYNDWLNTLIVPAELTETLSDSSFQLKPWSQLRADLGSVATVRTGTLFHELAHAEWDFLVEEGSSLEDRDLLSVFASELPKYHGQLGLWSRRLLASELFAYYRGDLISAIAQDRIEIEMSSGLDDRGACRGQRADGSVRDLHDNKQSYLDRAMPQFVYVQGKEVNLDVDPQARQALHAALSRHARATLQPLADRQALRARLASDQPLLRRLQKCRAP
ncbi:MAG TPA: hypothetical protein PLZ57_07005 [Pseudobdellovibrionaceae bacterium]|nr:hypothetical protein [Pseudobdellovibrionaceae bacterium]